MGNTSYKLLGIIQHEITRGGGGHYTAITNKSDTNCWHQYNNSDVQVVNFQYQKQNKTRIRYQRNVRIVFYRRIINDSNMVDNTRRLDNNNGEHTNILNDHANTTVLERLRPTATTRTVPTVGPEDENSRQREQNNIVQPEGIAIDHPTEPIAHANNIAIDSTRRDLDDGNLPIPPGVVRHAQDDVLPNANHQPRGDIVEFHQSSKCNQSPTMARPRLQTRAEMLMLRWHYDAMIRARAAEERNNILWPDIMVIECTEHAVQQSRQSQAMPTIWLLTVQDAL